MESLAPLDAVERGVPLLPAQPLHVALYLLELTETAEQKNTGHSTIDSALFGIRWGHKMAGVESPTQHPTVIAAAEGAKRRLSRPIQPKRPLVLETVVSIAQYYNTVSASLTNIRFSFVLLVGYAGLFRVSELLNVSIDDAYFPFVNGRCHFSRSMPSLVTKPFVIVDVIYALD